MHVSPWIRSIFVAVRSSDVRPHLKSDAEDMKMVVEPAAGQERLMLPGQVLPAVKVVVHQQDWGWGWAND